MERKKGTEFPWYVSTGIGIGASLLTNFSLYPFDLIRSRLQVASLQHNSKPWSIRALVSQTRHIFATAGLRGYYVGLSGGLLGPAVAWGSWYGTYTQLSQREDRAILGFFPSPSRNPNVNNFVCGIQAGFVMNVFSNPIFVVKTRMQTHGYTFQSSSSTSSSSSSTLSGKGHGEQLRFMSSAREIAQKEGWRGFYRGFLPSLPLTTHAALHWTFYEMAKRVLLARKQGEGQLSGLETTVAASTSKVLTTLITFPLQLLKVCLMAEKNMERSARIRSIVSGIWQANGFFGFYAGLLPHLLRTVPNATVTLFFIDRFERFLRQSSSSFAIVQKKEKHPPSSS